MQERPNRKINSHLITHNEHSSQASPFRDFAFNNNSSNDFQTKIHLKKWPKHNLTTQICENTYHWENKQNHCFSHKWISTLAIQNYFWSFNCVTFFNSVTILTCTSMLVWAYVLLNTYNTLHMCVLETILVLILINFNNCKTYQQNRKAAVVRPSKWFLKTFGLTIFFQHTKTNAYDVEAICAVSKNII